MTPSGVFLCVLVGLALGAALAWLLASTRVTRADRERVELAVRIEERESAAREKMALLGQTEEKLREAFEALSAEALRRNNQTFLDLARESLERFQRGAQEDLGGRQRAIGDLVRPVQESLARVDAKIQEIETEREASYRALLEQVTLMTAAQERLRSETASLVSALKNPSARGRWGEVQLRRVVEIAGMLDHCDFVEQTSIVRDERTARPDLVVRLPGGKHLVVDAKVPLLAYLEAQEIGDDAARGVKLDEHARQVRAHVAHLASKSYWSGLEAAPEFVVLFLPAESLFAEAVRRDPSLIEYAVAQGVIPASPTTLISLLKSAYHGWKQERIAENAERVRDLGVELYDRLRTLTEHLAEIGLHLDRAIDAFDRAAGSYERRVLVTARRFKELGASGAKDLPPLEPVGRTARRVEPDDTREEP